VGKKKFSFLSTIFLGGEEKKFVAWVKKGEKRKRWGRMGEEKKGELFGSRDEGGGSRRQCRGREGENFAKKEADPDQFAVP